MAVSYNRRHRITDERIDHHQQGRARQMEVGHHHVDHLPVVRSVDEQSRTAVQLAERRPDSRARTVVVPTATTRRASRHCSSTAAST
jgi:hypothetical protein